MTHTYMPIMKDQRTVATVPWEIFTPKDQARAQQNHGGQKLEVLAGRGGLAICELIAVLDDRAWRKEQFIHAWVRLWEIIAERNVQFKPRT